MATADPHWFRGFFEREWLDQVALRIPPEQTAAQVDFVVEALDLAPGARVLDLACGHGRHSVELARRGFRVTGLDLSQRSLALAREAATRADVEIELIHGDMREIPFAGEFDAVLNLFTAFGYFESDAENSRVLEAVERALRPGGLFLIDSLNVLAILRAYEPHAWRQLEDGVLFLEERRYDVPTGRNEVVWTFIRPDGERTQLTHSLRMYTPVELETLLARAELRVEETWGSFEGEPLSLERTRAIFRARKVRAA